MKLPSMRTPLSIAICSFAASPALAADLAVSVQIPQIDTAEYHRPYVAVWLEREDKSIAGNLALWYSQKKTGGPNDKPSAAPGGGEGGTKWLPDLRQWWRRSGREISVPVDGVSGATRPVGEQQLSFSEGKSPLGTLAPGHYKLMVEAAREDGGRETVDIAFDWPATAAQELKKQGKSELGAITLGLKP